MVRESLRCASIFKFRRTRGDITLVLDLVHGKILYLRIL